MGLESGTLAARLHTAGSPSSLGWGVGCSDKGWGRDKPCPPFTVGLMGQVDATEDGRQGVPPYSDPAYPRAPPPQVAAKLT